MPTFNDLYYPSVGNTKLKPEIARQWNVGTTLLLSPGKTLTYLSVRTDFYSNRIKDKIVAIPRQSMFIWSVENYGKVQIKGIDVGIDSRWALCPALSALISASYTYQEATDITNPNSKTYKHRIPYTPDHSGSGSAGLETGPYTIIWQIWYAGPRYSMAQNTPEYKLEGYSEQSLTVSRKIHIKESILRIKGEIQNIWDKSYQVVRSYPMPGRSFIIAVSYDF